MYKENCTLFIRVYYCDMSVVGANLGWRRAKTEGNLERVS